MGKVNYKKSEKTFVNPYNFVAVKEKKAGKINAEKKSDNTHTGCIHCELTVETPLAIPDVYDENVSKEDNDHMNYPAYRINGQLAIPGSSIRGMLRSVYEAATNSCMSTINPHEYLTKRSSIGVFKPCVLKKSDNGSWKLYKAERIALVCKGDEYKPIKGNYNRFSVYLDGKEKYVSSNEDNLYFGSEVSVKPKQLGYKKTVDTIKKGYGTNQFLYLGEAMSNKHAESVFKISENSEQQFLDDVVEQALNELEYTLQMYRSESINGKLKLGRHYGYYGYERAKNNGAIPLWYKETDSGKLKLSLAAIGRISFSRNVGELSNGHVPCVSREELCPACSVWGMVGVGKNNNGMGSKIRVTDAISSSEKPTKINVSLKELGAPRTSYLPFYSEKNKDYDDEDSKIRGRKFYWHIPAAAKDSSIYTTSVKNKRNATFELIDVGHKFKFDVYYDGLSDDQLKMLLWTIKLPAKDGVTLMHKLGHGKPLGLGSVKIEVLANIERKYSNQYALKTSDVAITEDDEINLLHKKSWEKLELMLKYDPDSKENIAYPSIGIAIGMDEKLKSQIKENDTASHRWFKEFSKESEAQLPDDKTELKMYDAEVVKSENNPKMNNKPFKGTKQNYGKTYNKHQYKK